jgi:hypothetical protein
MPGKTRIRRALLAAAALAALGACDLFDVGKDTLTLEVGSDGNSPVRLITSFEFVVYVDEEGQFRFILDSADTAWVQVPYTEDFDLNETGRFYARAAEAEDSTAAVSVRVLVDGEETFFEETVLVGEGTRYYFILY